MYPLPSARYVAASAVQGKRRAGRLWMPRCGEIHKDNEKVYKNHFLLKSDVLRVHLYTCTFNT